MTDDLFLPGLPEARLRAALEASPGSELRRGKFASPDSSAALVVNAFGWFLDRPTDLPPLAAGLGATRSVAIEAEMRLPWAGGTHPWLDVAVETDRWLIGIESKRYEPFRPAKQAEFSTAYDRPVWGEAMQGHDRLRRTHAGGARRFAALDMVQLVKHGYGLRTEALRRGKRALLLYLHAEPARFSNGRAIDPDRFAAHRADIDLYAESVAGDEVTFASLTWRDLLESWTTRPTLADHATRLAARFAPL
ncbi:MAG: hypothetical protein ACK4GW_06680 [Pseudorhodobacter sp.]